MNAIIRINPRRVYDRDPNTCLCADWGWRRVSEWHHQGCRLVADPRVHGMTIREAVKAFGPYLACDRRAG